MHEVNLEISSFNDAYSITDIHVFIGYFSLHAHNLNGFAYGMNIYKYRSSILGISTYIKYFTTDFYKTIINQMKFF